MATAKKDFDLVALNLGYNEYAVPKAAALHFMELFHGGDMYRLDTTWEGNISVPVARLVDMDAMPTLRLLGPVQFHQALENARMLDEKKRRKEKAAKAIPAASAWPPSTAATSTGSCRVWPR